jgi:hypothetical protein
MFFCVLDTCSTPSGFRRYFLTTVPNPTRQFVMGKNFYLPLSVSTRAQQRNFGSWLMFRTFSPQTELFFEARFFFVYSTITKEQYFFLRLFAVIKLFVNQYKLKKYCLQNSSQLSLLNCEPFVNQWLQESSTNLVCMLLYVIWRKIILRAKH